jgi:hypothetical protein
MGITISNLATATGKYCPSLVIKDYYAKINRYNSRIPLLYLPLFVHDVRFIGKFGTLEKFNINRSID